MDSRSFEIIEQRYLDVDGPRTLTVSEEDYDRLYTATSDLEFLAHKKTVPEELSTLLKALLAFIPKCVKECLNAP